MTTKLRKRPPHATRLAAEMDRYEVSDARLEVASGVSARTIQAVRTGRTATIRAVTASALARGMAALTGQGYAADWLVRR